MHRVLISKKPSGGGLGAKQREKIGSHSRDFHLFGLARARHGSVGHPDAGNFFERARILAHLQQLVIGSGRAAFFGEAGPNNGEAVGVRVGQRFQQDAMHHAEDGGVGANADREGDDRGQRE